MTIVTNTTFRLCPWAHVLMAFDARWWHQYVKEVRTVFDGHLVACSNGCKPYKVHSFNKESWFRHFGNSGAAAISLAICGGAKRVLMLGYDCQKTGGKVHWHGDHPAPLGNARSIANWPKQFKNVSKFAVEMRVNVINCSRETALACFPRVELSEALSAASVEAWASAMPCTSRPSQDISLEKASA